MAGDPTDVSLGEVGRALHALQEEIRALRGEHVRRDLYDAHRQATDEKLDRLRSELTDRDARADADRRMVRGALIAAALTLAVQLVMAYLAAQAL